MATAIMEEQKVVTGKSTLVRRVSDLFKADGNKGGQPSLFRHGSMQALRHCCQNLNLFPYLLHSFSGNSKEHAMPVKFNLCLAILVTRITERLLRFYGIVRHAMIHGLALEPISLPVPSPRLPANGTKPFNPPAKASSPKFERFSRQKPSRRSPWFLKLAVYFAPLVLALQLVGVFCLIAFGKYTPGFVFLVSALFFLGYISITVLVHDTTASVHAFKREKRKLE